MKKFSFLALAAVGLLFAACSSKDDVANEAPTIETNGSSFVGIAITMPSAASNTTRANDDLNNGIEEEFEVKSAFLFLFKGNEEATSTILGMWNLTNDFNEDLEGASEDDQPQTGVTYGTTDATGVTSTSVSVAKIDDLSLLPSENLYAYVIVNPYNDAQKTKPAANTTFEEFSQLTYGRETTGGSLEGAIASTGLMMTNSPVCDAPGGTNAPSGTIISAYKLDQSKIAKTAEAAKAAPAGCIFVERSAAKVTIGLDQTLNANIGTDGNLIPFVVDGWQVINVEPTYYNVRQANFPEWFPYNNEFMSTTTNKYRFVTKYEFDPQLPSPNSDGQIHVTTGPVYRTYFGKDVQYDVAATLNKDVAIDADANWLSPEDGRAYVPENTFDVANQIWTNTTQVTLRVKFNNGDDLFTISNDALYYQEADINDALAAKVGGLYAINQFKIDAADFIVNALKAVDPSKYYRSEVNVTAEVTKTTASNEAVYTLAYTITAQESTDGTNYTDIAAADIPALNQDLEGVWEDAVLSAKEDYKVAVFKGGYSYYNVRIKHFGEFETPWEAISAETANGATPPFKVQPGGNVANIYGYLDNNTEAQATASSRFLGRYGVVRDNWYKLNIEKISKLGSAVPESVKDDTTPDDEIEEEYYISAHVHIIPWVLRTQSVKF